MKADGIASHHLHVHLGQKMALEHTTETIVNSLREKKLLHTSRWQQSVLVIQ